MIVHWPAPGLAQRSKRLVEYEGGELTAHMADTLINTCKQFQALGIAAIQLGMPARMFVWHVDNGSDDFRVIINPELSEHQGVAHNDEGCLSLPGAAVQVERALSVRLRGFDLDGSEIDEVLEGLEARIVQHELDHLNGLLIIDRVSRQQRRAATRRCQKVIAGAS